MLLKIKRKKRVRFPFRILGSLILILLCSSYVWAEEAEDVKLKLSRKEALMIAEKLEVVQALYGLRGGDLVNCIEKSVVKPCDSEWVTCVEDAWVVKFTVGSQCPIKHDGRLNIVVLIDGNTGEVRSQYPEADYFKDKSFCRDKADCIQVNAKDSNDQPLDKQCYNFVYAQSQFSYVKEDVFKDITPSAQAIKDELNKISENCVCQQSRCENLPVK